MGEGKTPGPRQSVLQQRLPPHEEHMRAAAWAQPNDRRTSGLGRTFHSWVCCLTGRGGSRPQRRASRGSGPVVLWVQEASELELNSLFPKLL